MRSRSSSTLSMRTRSWSRVFSMAMPAASASASARASSSSLKVSAPHLVGQVEIAVDLGVDPDPDGHTEEGLHRGVPGRESVAVGV